jgi:formylmethanofuran dehydrogenase subunit E-like metal-binding protein
MDFFINDENIATKYIQELFTGSTKVEAFCKFNDCSKCFQTTKLYERVLNYHNSEIVQNIFNLISAKYTKKTNEFPIS